MSGRKLGLWFGTKRVLGFESVCDSQIYKKIPSSKRKGCSVRRLEVVPSEI